MPSIKIKSLPPDKADDAYDAGNAYRIDHQGAPGIKRERPMLDEDGMFVFNERRGTPRMERVRRSRAGYRYVSRSGVVIHVPMTAGSGRPLGSDPAREQLVKQRMFNRGSIRYGICPLRDDLSLRWLTKQQREEWEPCAPGSYGENKACKHIEMIIADRKAKHAAFEAKANEKYKTVAQQQLEEDRRANQNMAAIAKALSGETRTVSKIDE